MDADNLIRMANRIAAFFASMPDHAEAVDGVATHLKKFWEPRMHKQLLAVVASEQRTDLHTLVLEAVAQLQNSAKPAVA